MTSGGFQFGGPSLSFQKKKKRERLKMRILVIPSRSLFNYRLHDEYNRKEKKYASH